LSCNHSAQKERAEATELQESFNMSRGYDFLFVYLFNFHHQFYGTAK